MSPKVVKFVVVPATAVLGIASFRVHAVGETNVDRLLTHQQLSIYTPLPLSQPFLYVDEKPGSLQSGLGAVRTQLQSYLRAAKSSLLAVKVTAVNLYNTGEDVYYYLRDPPPGFLPRAGFITGAGLTGLVLARKGSRLRRLMLPLLLASLGAGISYPAQALAVLKVSGRQAWAASQWSASAVSSLWPAKEPSPGLPTPPPSTPPPTSTPPPPPPSASTPPADSHPSQSSDPEPMVPPVAAAIPVPDPEPATADPYPAPATAPAPPALPCHPQLPEIGLSAPTSAPDISEETLPEGEPQPSLTFTPAECSTPGEEAAEERSPAGKKSLSVDPQLMDFGQSNPEDDDLYTTRG